MCVSAHMQVSNSICAPGIYVHMQMLLHVDGVYTIEVYTGRILVVRWSWAHAVHTGCVCSDGFTGLKWPWVQA